jgi:hypothetical protein
LTLHVSQALQVVQSDPLPRVKRTRTMSIPGGKISGICCASLATSIFTADKHIEIVILQEVCTCLWLMDAHGECAIWLNQSRQGHPIIQEVVCAPQAVGGTLFLSEHVIALECVLTAYCF